VINGREEMILNYLFTDDDFCLAPYCQFMLCDFSGNRRFISFLQSNSICR